MTQRKVVSVSCHEDTVKLLAELSEETGLYRSQTVELALRHLKLDLDNMTREGKLHAS